MAETTSNGSYRVFALKYRPQTFKEVVGQTAVVRQLQGEIRDNRVGHAYLFTGPRGVGKTSMARIFAKALNCVEGPTDNPCGQCVHCQGIANDSDLDVVEVDAATYTRKEETIELLEGIDRAAFNARYKVYIIDEVHMFSTHSFNVLLKRLEEPPSGVVFILATTNPEKIPETVISRCRRLEFDRMETVAIVGRLLEICEREKVEFAEGERDEVLQAIALASEGGMRDSQVSLDQLISLSEGPVTLETAKQLLGFVENELLQEMLKALVERDSVTALRIVQTLVDKGRDVHRFVKTFTAFLRDGMLLKAGAPVELLRVSRATPEPLRKAIEPLSLPACLNMMQQFLDLEEKLRGPAPARFLLEFTLLKLTAIHPRFVLDAMDAGKLHQSGATEGAQRPGPVEVTPENTPQGANVVSLAMEEGDEADAGAAAVFMEPAVADPAAEMGVAVMVGDDEPAAAISPWPPTEAAKVEFVRTAGRQMPGFDAIIADAEVTFPVEGRAHLLLAAKDGIMRGHLQRPENVQALRAAAHDAFGRDCGVTIGVAVIAPEEGLQEPEEEAAEERAAPAPVLRASTPAQPAPAAPATTAMGPEPAIGNLGFREALEKFADLREAVEMLKQHCGVDPVLFNGQRIS